MVDGWGTFYTCMNMEQLKPVEHNSRRGLGEERD
jgi:hypothetical protein